MKGTGMNKDDMILISVDDHVVEPPDMFKNHLPRSIWMRRRGWCTTRTGRIPGSSVMW